MDTRTLVFSEDSIREFERMLEQARYMCAHGSEELDHEEWSELTQKITLMAIRKFLP